MNKTNDSIATRIESHNTPSACQSCGSLDVDWQTNVHGEPAWGVCRNCGKTVEVQEVLTWRARLTSAFARLQRGDRQ